MINESFEVHEELNPKLWDKSGKLLPEVRSKIVEIVAAFEEYIKAPIEIVDIQLVGSNASYNYTATSDLDVHIIANFELVTEDTEILQSLYNVKKSKFNKDYDISIHGVDIEIYVQDIKAGIHSNGIYSVCDDEWVKEPKPIKSITKHNTEKEVEKWSKHITDVINSGDSRQIKDTINMLHLMRANSLAVDGEYGKGNEIFKQLRNLGFNDKLKEASKQAMSKELTLEGMTKGQLVSRI